MHEFGPHREIEQQNLDPRFQPESTPAAPSTLRQPLGPSTLLEFQNAWSHTLTNGAEGTFTSPDRSIAGFCLRGIGGPKPRDYHEDSLHIVVRKNTTLRHFLVVDGMGRIGGGDVASSVVTRVAAEGLVNHDDLQDILTHAPAEQLWGPCISAQLSTRNQAA